MPPAMGQYAGEHTKAWAATIGSYDGFIFVSPEYNHSTSGVLKNVNVRRAVYALAMTATPTHPRPTA